MSDWIEWTKGNAPAPVQTECKMEIRFDDGSEAEFTMAPNCWFGERVTHYRLVEPAKPEREHQHTWLMWINGDVVGIECPECKSAKWWPIEGSPSNIGEIALERDNALSLVAELQAANKLLSEQLAHANYEWGMAEALVELRDETIRELSERQQSNPPSPPQASPKPQISHALLTVKDDPWGRLGGSLWWECNAE